MNATTRRLLLWLDALFWMGGIYLVAPSQETRAACLAGEASACAIVSRGFALVLLFLTISALAVIASLLVAEDPKP